ncbi:MAG: hypothetical protein OEM97_04120, partial [Acidimicrobiia bacterium]|nr:hypothetical protein [Acidimicrobiia bacterium]
AEPVFTLVFGAAALSEPVGVLQLAGGSLIVADALIAQRGAPGASRSPVCRRGLPSSIPSSATRNPEPGDRAESPPV